MKTCLLAAFVLLPVFAPAQEKWRVGAADGSVYAVGRTQAEAVERAVRRSKLERGSSEEGAFEAKKVDGATTVNERLAEETATEVLLRLERLRALEGDVEDRRLLSVRDAVQKTMERYAEAADKLKALDQGLEQALFEVALLDLEASQKPEPDVRLLAEPFPLSSFEGSPAGFRAGYVALLERVDGYRPANAVTTEPSRKRDQMLKAQVVPGGETRFVFEPASSVGGVATVRYRMVSRSAAARKEAMVTDLWKGKGGRYLLAATKVEPIAASDVAEVRERIVQRAKGELDDIRKRQAAREEEARLAAEERRKRKAEEERRETERREQEERDRRQKEERLRQREEYTRQFDGLQNELDHVVRNRDDAARSLPEVRRDLDRYEDEARRLKRDRDEARDRVRELEDKLEQAKREDKPTGVIEQVLREAKQQYDDKNDRYRDADRRADSARQKAESLAQNIRTLEDRRSQIESELHRLKSLIDSLGV